MHSSVRTVLSGLVSAGLVLLAGWLVLPMQLGGSTAYVTTAGVSMEPEYFSGDLAVLRPAPSYDVGDVAAYHSDLLDAVVLHRIVATDPQGHTLKGDANAWLDPERPATGDLIGRAVLRIPQGGLWLERLTGPVPLGLTAFALVGGIGAFAGNRRRRRSATMARHVHRTAPSVLALPPALLALGAVAILVGVGGLALGVLAYATPTTVTSESSAPGRTISFSYRAQVPPSAAYDDTAVRQPDPVFRALTQQVEVGYAYTGQPGRVRVYVDLSTTSGWRSTYLAAPRVSVDGEHAGTVALDLRAIDRRAARAAEVIGIPAGQVDVVVRPEVLTRDGAVFSAELPLVLTPERLTLTDGTALTVTDDGTTATRAVARTWTALGVSLSASSARTLAPALVALAVLVLALLAVLLRRGWSTNESDDIHRRFGSLLLRVHPMVMTSGRPVVDVADFATLAKLADRYGLLVLHWSRSGVETFVVQDEGTTYRYRAGEGTVRRAVPAGRR